MKDKSLSLKKKNLMKTRISMNMMRNPIELQLCDYVCLIFCLCCPLFMPVICEN